ncbi:hypothetical protein SLS62_008758 [Diatrype stigma]|uniref:Uncharacterized protein n=1 Tax=Diatrype stigma TaxID=117547 RepID=A0AAN9UIN5_9PEZI
MSQEPESPALDETQHRDRSFRQDYGWLLLSFLATPFRMMMDCISVNPPRVDSPDMLNAALLSDEAHRENDSRRLRSHHSCGAHDNIAQLENLQYPVGETSRLLQHSGGCRAQPDYTQLNHSSSKDTKKDTSETKARPIEIDHNQGIANHQSIPKTNSQAAQTQSSFHSGSRRSRDISSAIAGCCIHYLSPDSESDSDCAIESYETPPTDRSRGTGTDSRSGKSQGAETNSSTMPITYAKSLVKVKEGISLISLSLRQEQQQKQKKQQQGKTTRSAPMRAYGQKLSGRRQSVQHVRFLSGLSREEMLDKRETARLMAEGRKGAIQVYKDATIDSAEADRFLIDWIEEHQHYWI